jgi:hypothetical protein
MSAAPYPEFPVQQVKLAMALGYKGYYRLNQIQLRQSFARPGKKPGCMNRTRTVSSRT